MVHARKRVAVGLSGGVDSSVAAAILLEKGYDVIGITMVKYDGSDGIGDSLKQSCYGPGEKNTVESAASVCRDLGIPFHGIDLKQEFRETVIEHFRHEYLEGRTPNPCVVCNRSIKFGSFPEKARAAGIDFEWFATGHYARIEESGNRLFLRKGTDSTKDQSYFLYSLTQEQLSCTLFPLGGYTKRQVREMAPRYGLTTGHKAESQDFIANNSYSSLFGEEETRGGDIVNGEGTVLGRHRGIIHYTVGQRKGLGISSPTPLYVRTIDPSNNRIVVSELQGLFAGGLIAANLNLISLGCLDRPLRVKAKIRYRHEPADATLLPADDKAKVLFDEPQKSVTPGQSVVLYEGERVVGGGVIESTL